MRVLVCGGRNYDDFDRVCEVLDAIKPTFLVEGGASGADLLARKWAKRNLPASSRKTVYADWARHGLKAGPLRNQQMIDEHEPDLVVAFPGGKGTADMIGRAKRSGLEVREIT